MTIRLLPIIFYTSGEVLVHDLGSIMPGQGSLGLSLGSYSAGEAGAMYLIVFRIRF